MSRGPLRIVALAFGAMVAALAAAGPDDRPSGVPFAATVLTTEQIRFDAADCTVEPFLAGTTDGIGRIDATGVVAGTVVGRGGDCITPTTPFTFAFSRGRFTLTTSDGDEIHAVYDGDLVPSPLPFVQMILGKFRIVGGTGRHARAEGAGGITGLESLATGQGLMHMNGTMSWQASGAPDADRATTPAGRGSP